MALALRRRVTEPSRASAVHIPAPLGGLNTVAPAGGMDPSECLQLYNLISGFNGLNVRPGYEEWVTGLGDPVRMLISYKGSMADLLQG